MPLQLNAKPSCANPEYDPEWWYPDPQSSRVKSPEVVEHNRQTLANAVLAMQICQECPLFADQSCLEYAMSDTTTIDYGIYASTLPTERRAAVGQTPHVLDKNPLFGQIRHQATRMGVIPVRIAPKERPKSSTLNFLDRRNDRDVLQQDLSA